MTSDGSGGSRPGVSIVLATYNGSKYLPEFLASVRAQSWPEVELIASDDSSQDDTTAICRDQGPAHTTVLANGSRLGVVGNFSRAIGAARHDYLAFADQDDVWLPAKISELMQAMGEAEARHSRETPLLAFSDLTLISESGATLVPSFFRTSLKSPRCSKPIDFLINNHIPGCAMLVNRALIERAMPIPEGLRLHDWWFALVAASLGKIIYVDQPLVLYRQHASNAVGAPLPRTWRRSLVKGLRHPYSSLSKSWASLSRQATGARVAVDHLVRRYRQQLGPDDYRALQPFLSAGHYLDRLKALAQARVGETRTRSIVVGLML